MNSLELKDYLMNTLCRICAEKGSKLVPILENKLLPLKIHKCLPIKVTAEDELPINICEICLLKIDESYLLYETCYYADQRLKDLWKSLMKEQSASSSEIFLSKETYNQEKSIASENFSDEYPIDVYKKVPVNMLLVGDAETFNDKDFSERNKADDILIPSSIIINIADESDYSTLNALDSCKVSMTPFDSNNIFQSSEGILQENIVPPVPINYNECNTENKIEDCRQTILHELVGVKDEPITEDPSRSDEKLFLCDACGKSFKRSNNLKRHIKIHLKHRKKYACKICSKTFFTNFFLQEHMNTHTGETPYMCTTCGKEFKERVHLRQHKWTHSTEKFLCPVCGSHFNRKGNMMEHIKKYHSGSEKEKRRNVKLEAKKLTETEFSCSMCQTTFYSEAALNTHKKGHKSKQFHFCPLCGKQFRHSGSLTYHRRTAHTGEKPFECSYCDERFSLRSVQKIHERKKHTFEYPYKCPNCFRLFSNSSSLKNHSYVHMKEKMFECDVCGKKFSRSSNLFVHKKIHSDDRQYTCEQCGKSYIQKHDMIKHKKVHDPKTKPFFCKYCANSFAHKKDFSRHAVCHFNYIRKSNSDMGSAEKILEAVTGNLPHSSKTLIDAERLILESSVEIPEEEIPKVDATEKS